MGRDKALIPVQGVPLLQRVCEVALKCATEVYVVTPWPERYQDILPDTCHVVQEALLSGESKSHGPLVGFAQGLAQVKTDWVLLLACDLAQLQVEVLQSWAMKLENVPQEAIALLSRQPKGWEPLCGFYRRQCLPMLTQFIDEGGRSFQRWLSQSPVQELQVRDPQIFFNCNTPTDLERINSSREESCP